MLEDPIVRPPTPEILPLNVANALPVIERSAEFTIVPVPEREFIVLEGLFKVRVHVPSVIAPPEITPVIEMPVPGVIAIA